jgi:hypothetical protein
MTDALMWFLIGWNLVCFGFLGWAWIGGGKFGKLQNFLCHPVVALAIGYLLGVMTR